MENYLIAAAVATIAPSLLVKGFFMTLSGGWSLGKRAIYGKEKTESDIILELKEKIELLNERERKIDLKLDQILKHNYYGHSSDNVKTDDNKNEDKNDDKNDNDAKK